MKRVTQMSSALFSLDINTGVTLEIVEVNYNSLDKWNTGIINLVQI